MLNKRQTNEYRQYLADACQSNWLRTALTPHGEHREYYEGQRVALLKALLRFDTWTQVRSYHSNLVGNPYS